LTASSDANALSAITVGLAASQQKSSTTEEAPVAPAAAVTETPANLSSRSVDRVMYGDLPSIEGVDTSSSWDSELDDILGDLDDELEARSSV
jgi:hypothetical protein